MDPHAEGSQSYTYGELKGLSERDLDMIVAPGLRVGGFNTVSEGEDFCTTIALAVLGDSVADEVYEIYKGNPISLHGQGALDTVLRRRRGIITNRARFSSEVMTPIEFELLPEDRDRIPNQNGVVGPVVNLRVSGVLSTYREELDRLGVGQANRTLTLNDEIIFYTRLRKNGRAPEPKPYIYVSTRSLDKDDSKAVALRNQESSERWRCVIVRGLRHPFRAGAVGLGKKS
ncbi:hypothetical protein A3D80_01965 [Candidatus Roizmanbacteria bacterium RIFCSPHIGHO2_02_FULL_40_13b]|uniref:Uncharacterized protein n=1 Tax=Candidatus Roizmanbacteria bacterium RIFCSPHIGHO2_01_FULL_39_24 TaxID=1802032 RepID=A0A1F7GLJ6_9BACT|nr:MAG: hypothetical protein A2799_01325 [Candidatus Roizmanbacteria bacterium RIFCSPHIGHO2_01_FULL_39_24]OGK26894.1 MAG: hypothetical protein A3D80_01965 [Candidatus Roizmanbacteria bacterium RIFCSPHIGHO2_02_FULL_40_13b]OGK49373.1 MAG: hypothetical protein A3A56_03815 [Candidatus Roizmanbacteria bacterium RIFCSPLOWO2_01_FULL_40_32]OGK57431.1 MAG: hypothetical protein A3H83_01455 [Candidatus Roizmanbacteria bacterium RIFCSPLOWO2_02_FULL_39_8]